MLTDNYILFLLGAELLLVAYRKCARSASGRSFRGIFALGLLGLCGYNLWTSLHAPNLYRFLDVPRDFPDEDLGPKLKQKMAQFHPDQPAGDNDLFLKASELKEVVESPRAKRLFALHRWFGVDPREAFYDKFSNQNFETFQVEIFSGLSFNAFAIALIHALLFEEVTSSNVAMTVSYIFVLGGLGLEAFVFGHPFVADYKPAVVAWLQDLEVTSKLTIIQAVSFLRLALVTIGFILMILYFEIKNLRKKPNLDEMWDDVSRRIRSGNFIPQNHADEVHTLSRKVDKRVKTFEREMRTVFWSLVLCPLGLFLNYFNGLQWLADFAGSIFKGR